jgi:hypothetical protein
LGVVDALDDVKSEVSLTMPSKIALSGGIGEARKWLVGGKLLMAKLQVRQIIITIRLMWAMVNMVAFRGYFIPNYNSFTSYAKRIVYRAGLKYEKQD